MKTKKHYSMHGLTHTLEYWIYHAMLGRCYNQKNKDFKHYGGRGIKVCERWQGKNGMENFYADMGKKPDGKTLDRKDNNGNYEPSNCHWATWHDQVKNKRVQTHCINGHEFTFENTRSYMRDGTPRRGCLACERKRQREDYRRKTALPPEKWRGEYQHKTRG